MNGKILIVYHSFLVDQKSWFIQSGMDVSTIIDSLGPISQSFQHVLGKW